MNDLISRQAAIDEIYTLFRESDFIHYNHGIADSLATLHKLPPAQQWIPVSERLPEKEGYYLLTVESLIAEAGSVVISRPYNGRGGFCDVYWNNVIAWMPLPEPYKEENNEQVQG